MLPYDLETFYDDVDDVKKSDDTTTRLNIEKMCRI